VLHDPYERVNFWSHFLPGLAFITLGVAAYNNLVLGGQALVIFCAAATTTHICSAITHIWPDDHLLEKLDHVGIVATILGTPFTAVMAKDPEGDRTLLAYMALGLLAAAFMRPLLRVLTFVALGGFMFAFYFQVLVNWNLGLQVIMYLAGGYSFIQNGGHDRWPGLTDHHFLHYWVSISSCLHVFYIRNATQHQLHHT